MENSSPSKQVDRALVCVGAGQFDHNALKFTKDFVEAMNLLPVIFHASASGLPNDETDRLLAEVREILGMEDVELKAVQGNVKAAISTELDRQEYKVIILGTTSREPELQPTRLSQDIANQVAVSALLMRNPPQEVKKILVCTGGHSASNLAISWSILLAKATEEEVTILHVVSSAPTMYTGLQALEEDLSELLSRDIPLAHHLKDAAALAEKEGVHANLELRHGLVIEEILRSSDVYPHRLVVLGAPSSHKIINRLLRGRIAPKLLASTHRSILIVRGEPH